ncbi:hypothetical protein NDU88_002678 [Pleurodeles waltl]|uniref:Uncharacterized protein n=1 Tax=Pleurodeles waltl TaxID=8319 RepID=A0AAV7SEA5_PLEWA|nr:hypothetical protein NDU88_002678 [Pleurodeles waltl]
MSGAIGVEDESVIGLRQVATSDPWGLKALVQDPVRDAWHESHALLEAEKGNSKQAVHSVRELGFWKKGMMHHPLGLRIIKKTQLLQKKTPRSPHGPLQCATK